MIRLLVCDDSDVFRAALRTTLAEQPEITVVGEAADGQEAVDPAMLEAGATAHCVKDAPLRELELAVAGAAEPFVRLAHTLAKSADACGAAELVVREIAELTGGAGAAVYVAAPDAGLSLASAAGPALRPNLTSAPGVAVECFRGGKLVLANRRELAELSAEGLPCDQALAVPLLADGETLGVVLVAGPPGAGLQIDHGLIAAVADLAAAAIANERRIALTYDEARRDALTGLPNREPVGIALVDLDDFTRINDTHGHQAGDDILREVARVATRGTRAEEVYYRLGGDELAVLVQGGRQSAELVTRRFLAGLRGHRRGLPLPTASAGIAASPEDGETRDELLAIAGLALYTAKAEGGDDVADLSASNHDLPPASEASLSSDALAGFSPRAPHARVVALPLPGPGHDTPQTRLGPLHPARVLVVDDDERLRMLLRTTLELIDIEIDEAASVPAARSRIADSPPDVVVLDLGLAGRDGLTLCEELSGDRRTRDIGIVVLTGSNEYTYATAWAAGADAYLSKPFSPLDLLAVVEQLAGGLYEGPFRISDSRPPEEQLIRYAEDLRRLLDIEHGQRALIQNAYRQTVEALASALEAKDLGTNAHSHRVQKYAMELAWLVEPRLVEEPSVEYGFLLHDVGKIGIPDRILNKPEALTESERRILETHVILGEQMLGDVALLEGAGLKVVRHHHERWDGDGYPDRLSGYDIPLPARIFAVADALDAMTSDRPYRAALGWDEAMVELIAHSGRQFDPNVVDAVMEREPRLRAIHADFAASTPSSQGLHLVTREADA